MKKLWFAAPVLGLGLVACAVSVSVPAPTVSALSATSNYQYTAGGVTKDVICDDRPTDVTVAFSYAGNLQSFTTQLVGVNTGEKAGIQTFTSSTGGIVWTTNNVSVTYTIPAGTAPLSVKSAAPKAIIVTPTVIGQTKVQVTVRSPGGATKTYETAPIDVASTCPNP